MTSRRACSAAAQQYTYNWKTVKGWTARQLVIRFVDGTERVLWVRI